MQQLDSLNKVGSLGGSGRNSGGLLGGVGGLGGLGLGKRTHDLGGVSPLPSPPSADADGLSPEAAWRNS